MKDLLKEKWIICFLIFIIVFTIIASCMQDDIKKDLKSGKAQVIEIIK